MKRLLKGALYVSLFCLLLVSGVISKATLLYASSNVKIQSSEDKYINPYNYDGVHGNDQFSLVCLDYKRIHNVSFNHYTNHTNCVLQPRQDIPGYSTNSTPEAPIIKCLVPSNKSGNAIIKPRGGEPMYESQICEYATVQWVWCLFLLQITPYFFTAFRCLWYIAFRTKKFPTIDVLIMVSLCFTFKFYLQFLRAMVCVFLVLKPVNLFEHLSVRYVPT